MSLPGDGNIEAWIEIRGTDWVDIPHTYWRHLRDDLKWPLEEAVEDGPPDDQPVKASSWNMRTTFPSGGRSGWWKESVEPRYRFADPRTGDNRQFKKDTPIAERERDSVRVALSWQPVYQARVNGDVKQLRIRYLPPSALRVTSETPGPRPPLGAQAAVQPGSGTTPPPRPSGS